MVQLFKLVKEKHVFALISSSTELGGDVVKVDSVTNFKVHPLDKKGVKTLTIRLAVKAGCYKMWGSEIMP